MKAIRSLLKNDYPFFSLVKRSKTLVLSLICLFGLVTYQTVTAQVKIGNNPNTINSNSLLELESTNKGFLPPRIALNDLNSVAPLTGTVPSGMLVYSSGGALVDGFYYWNGSSWRQIGTTTSDLITKTADCSLNKTEKFVLASNDITVTLPAVASADNGLEITIKNIGAHTDLITIKGNGTATIDGNTETNLTKNNAQTFVASDGNWIIKNSKKYEDYVMTIDEHSSWTTIKEAIEFLNEHMTTPVVIKLTDDEYDIAETITINLPFPVTFEGVSYGHASIIAANGLSNKPMFRCVSECYFKMLAFDATTLSGYGTHAGEDGIRLLGIGTYNEVKDCSFDGFYNAILDSTNAELWLFETDINNAHNNGLLIHGATPGVIVKVAETDFIGCTNGVNMSKGTQATIQLASGGYYNTTGTAILYQPSTFTNFLSISITGNSWDNLGSYISGFDFSRSDGRDANAIVESNAGTGDQRPNCFINVINSTTSVSLTALNQWYKANWGSNTFEEVCKWTVSSNRITYQPANHRNGVFTVSGNLTVNANSQNISICIVKNGNIALQFGETTLRVVTSDQPSQFSFNAFVKDIAPGDYFEIWYSNATSSGKTIKIQDIQWAVNTQ
jgi:hypothetical protein